MVHRHLPGEAEVRQFLQTQAYVGGRCYAQTDFWDSLLIWSAQKSKICHNLLTTSGWPSVNFSMSSHCAFSSKLPKTLIRESASSAGNVPGAVDLIKLPFNTFSRVAEGKHSLLLWFAHFPSTERWNRRVGKPEHVSAIPWSSMAVSALCFGYSYVTSRKTAPNVYGGKHSAEN